MAEKNVISCVKFFDKKIGSAFDPTRSAGRSAQSSDFGKNPAFIPAGAFQRPALSAVSLPSIEYGPIAAGTRTDSPIPTGDFPPLQTIPPLPETKV